MTPSGRRSKDARKQLLTKLRAELGADRIVTQTTMQSDAGATTDFVLVPRTPSEVAALVKSASAAHIRLRLLGHHPREDHKADDLWFDLGRLDHLLDLDPSSHLVAVQSGIRMAALEGRLDAQGLTIGGALDDDRRLVDVLASPLPVDAPVQARCIGMSALLPTGTQVHVRPSPRRATGPDLMSFFLGKHFANGLVLTATLRLSKRKVHTESDRPAGPAIHKADRKTKPDQNSLCRIMAAISRKLDPSGILG